MSQSKTPRGANAPWGVVASVVLALISSACLRAPRERIERSGDQGYPTCDGAPLPEGGVVAEGVLRAGPSMVEPSVSERFTVKRRGCVVQFSGRQDWSLSISQLDVVYDAESGRPLRAWKRTLSPGTQPGTSIEDTRRYELRGDRVELAQRGIDGELLHFALRGPVPQAVIGPGRGMLTPWIQRARLAVGERVRVPVLDLREAFEVVRDVTLRREADRDDPVLGRVRVYTIYGREPVYADENDVVIGDMTGLVRADTVAEPMPAPFVEPPPADPTHGPD